MYGAIIGDIVGSKYEFHSIKGKEFPLVSAGCDFTDDTVMTIAVARALIDSRKKGLPFAQALVREMQELGRKYPNRGYGGRFDDWLYQDDPKPYNSFGNGSAMRVSPCGLIASTMDEALALARASAEVTHNHPEGIKGARAVAAAIFLAKTHSTKQEIRDYIAAHFYNLDFTVEEIRQSYRYDVTCQGSVPQSIACFLDAYSYEDAIRNAVSLGGDADTQAAIAGSIAWSYYRLGNGYSENHGTPGYRETGLRGQLGWPSFCEEIVSECAIDDVLPAEFVETIEVFAAFSGGR